MEVEERVIERGPLTLRIRPEGDRGIRIEAHGDLDLSNAEALDLELSRAVESDAERIVLDLSGLDYLDSTGMGVLAKIQTSYGTERFAVFRASDRIQRVLALTGLDEALPFIDPADEGEADP